MTAITRAPIRLCRVAVAILLALAVSVAAPVVAQEIDPEIAAIERGRVVFESTAGGVGCAACHARFGTGDVGPAIRGSTGHAITAALSSIPDMEFITLTDAELNDLVAYLAFLGRFAPTMITVHNSELSMRQLEMPVGGTIQLIITNRDDESYLLLSEGLGDHRLDARSVIDLTWTAPDEPGRFVVRFGDSHGVASALVITTE